MLRSWIPDADALRLIAGPTLTWPLDGAQLDALRADPARTPLIAVDAEGRPVGHVTLCDVEPGHARIAHVIVDPARRGEGLGRALMEAALTTLRERVFVTADLNVFAGNVAAIATYTALGFVDQGPLEGHPGVLRLALSL